MSESEVAVDLRGIRKEFVIPSSRRQTLREHALDLFRPRPVERLRVLDDVTLSIASGETLGLMGRNGCGKSTLLKIIAGIYPADEGSVRVSGRVTPILELGVGFNPELTAVDNIFLLGTVMGLSHAEVKDSLNEILAFAGVHRFAHQKVQHFSSGMAARLAYAVAFSAVEDVLLLDEILAVGDAGFRSRCEARFRDLASEGRTVVLVSHDSQTIVRHCVRALLLDHGRVVMDDEAGVVAQEYERMFGTRAAAAPIT